MIDKLTFTNTMNTAQKFVRYKAWANQRTFTYISTLPPEEASKPRSTYFGSITQTLHHTYIVDDIFKAHIEGRAHGYLARRKDTAPPFAELRQQVESMDNWWIEHADQLSIKALSEIVSFEFIGGEKGAMSHLEIILHIVNHASYHRGFVDEVLEQFSQTVPASDFPVYLSTMAK